jgi:DNA-binding NarL/FixJ family response regulator
MPGAKAMCSIWGGLRYYVPKQPSATLVELLGELIAARLVCDFGGDYIDLPVPDVPAARRVEARDLLANGYSASEVAKRLGVSLRTVRRFIAEGAMGDMRHHETQ